MVSRRLGDSGVPGSEEGPAPGPHRSQPLGLTVDARRTLELEVSGREHRLDVEGPQDADVLDGPARPRAAQRHRWETGDRKWGCAVPRGAQTTEPQ